MSDLDTSRLIENAEAGRQVRWLIGLRLLVALLFLGSAAVLAARGNPPFASAPLFVLVGCTCLLSLLYLVWLSRSRQTRTLCSVQIWIDSVLVTALVHFTGGIDSLFAFVYIFPILAAAIFLSRRSSLLVAGASSTLYGALITAQIYGLPGLSRFTTAAGGAHDSGYALFQTYINSVAFFLIALLGSQLPERLKQAGREVEEHRAGLRDLQTLHQDIVENIPSGIITLDLQGRIVSWNRNALRIIGLTLEEIRDKSWRDTPFREVQQLETLFSAPSPSFTGFSREIEIARHDGQSVLIGISIAPLRAAHGELVGLVGIFQDLTERKRIEAKLRQADRLAAVGRLAAGLAHEVRNPLAAISGSIQLMKEEGEVRPQLLDIILREADRLKLTTGQFLDFAKPPSVGEKRCNLVKVLEEIALFLEKSCESAMPVSVSLHREAEELMVAADPDQLKQVFWNLGLNAIQAMPSGGRLTLAVRRHEPEDGSAWAVVEFTDTGGGIPPEEVDRIFDPFYTTKADGTGLGLAISRRIVEHLGGWIEVVSKEGQGTTFNVFIKRAAAEACSGYRERGASWEG